MQHIRRPVRWSWILEGHSLTVLAGFGPRAHAITVTGRRPERSTLWPALLARERSAKLPAGAIRFAVRRCSLTEDSLRRSGRAFSVRRRGDALWRAFRGQINRPYRR